MEINKLEALPYDIEKIESINREISSLHSIFQSCTETINERKQKIFSLQNEMEAISADSHVPAELPFGSMVKMPPDIARDLIMQEINSTYDSISNLMKALELMKNGKS